MKGLAPSLALTAVLALAAALLGGLGLELSGPMLAAPPAPPRAAPPRPPAAAPAAGPDEDALDELVQTVLARPLLHPSRRPQQEHPPEPAAVPDTEAELPRLAGVLVTPDGRRAMFAPATGRPRLLAEGDSLGRYTIKAIAPHEVTLAGSEGDRVIRPSHLKTTPAGAPPRSGVPQ